ncbi:ABC transporter [Thalassiosira pseudonana CCMP1335]|uniref:ABC transporter n=1 Tax=Thalassiosira pseudonana TaxID=35128 RepID=B8C2B9_THAPS|nr:ABC transporter [Thalassiosira pseudonana CCMP1335]EED92357.1 ABC transporter [Thalassiosira pseudonana CCMP1335]
MFAFAFISCLPLLTSAWSGAGTSGIPGIALASRHHLSSNSCNRTPSAQRLSPLLQYRGGSTLWSAPNGEDIDASSREDVSVVDNSNDADEDDNNGKLTPRKASALLSTFWSMAYPYYQESQPGRRLFYGMILLTLMNSGVSVAFSYVSKDFWNALSSKDVNEFYNMMVKFGGALVVGAPVAVMYRYQREQLAVHWREWMTDRTLQLYNSNRVYYALERDNNQSKRIDNPDQRITEDVRTFTAFSLQLFITVVTSIIDLVSFSLILYSIQPQLFATIIGYALFGTLTTTYIGGSLLPLNFAKLRREADLRYLLVRIRENAESIAFYGGEDVENKEVTSRLGKVVENKREINAAQRNLELFTTAYQYLIQVVPVAVVAPQYFAGTIQLGVISQSVGAFNHILSDLTVIVNQFEQLSSFSAGIERLSTFMTAMRDADPKRSNEDGLLSLPAESTGTGAISLLSTSSGQKAVLIINKLNLMTPDRKRSLIQGLDLTVREGENLLIVGNSGAGKSSLLRAIAGLWTSGSGEIARVPDDEVYFLPQRPYCALGSLKDQLLYPSTEAKAHLLRQTMSDEDLLKVLEMVDLKELPSRFGDGDPMKGSNTLSLGEQQRLAFGRLVVNQPRLVILDEATSALDVVSEAKMYSLLREMAKKELNKGKMSRPGLTFISVGHRPTLIAYHDAKLRLNGGSDYVIESIEKTFSIPDISTVQGL